MEKNFCGGPLAPRVNCSDDSQMISLGLRRARVNVDRGTFKKDAFEKKTLKCLKDRNTPKKIVVRVNDVRDNEAAGTLIVYLKNTKKLNSFKTTYSYRNVKKSEVDGIIFRLSERKLSISKYYFNQ